MRMIITLLGLLGLAASAGSVLPEGWSQEVAAAPTKAAAFSWVNRLPESKTSLLRHGTFYSPSNGSEVGYYIYLPPGYESAEAAARRYPVVYYLHGGRPGGEQVSINMVNHFHEAISSGRVPPMIYVFVNGGLISHYDYPAKKSFGEAAFIRELLPHIDRHYRTRADRAGRGVEGFSQGGRGTARIAFKYPELFCSAAPMGGGHQHEHYISLHAGQEETGLQFESGNNTYDLARQYAAKRQEFPLSILVVVGSQDFNYQANRDWTAFLQQVGIPFEFRLAGDAPHNAQRCYAEVGDEVMLFHARNFGLLPK